MAALEICGVILGVIPLVISALEHYKAGKGVVAAFVKWRGKLDTLIFRLKLQRTFFYLHTLELLREAQVAALRDRVDLTEEECVAILRDKQTGEEIRRYLGDLYGIFEEVLSRYELCLKTIVAEIRDIVPSRNTRGDDLVAILAANTPHNGEFSFRKRLKFTIKRGSLKNLLEELREDRLSLEIIIKGLKTQNQYLAKEPDHDAQRLAISFVKVQQRASALFAAMCKCCSCFRVPGHGLLLRLDNRVPMHRVRAKVAEKTNEPTEFALFIGLRKILQEVSVRAHETGPSLERPATVNYSIRPISITQEQGRAGLQGRELISNVCGSAMTAFRMDRRLKLDLIAHDFSPSTDETEARREVAISTTLEKFLRRGVLNEDARMTPKQQTMLALDIAASLMQLRQTSWSLVPWTNRSIRFLLSKQGEVCQWRSFVEELIKRRNIRASLDPTPKGPDPKEALLELAILLLEIWHHRTLDIWVSEKGGIIPIDTPEARRIAAIRWLELTSNRLPPHHLTAIEQCLAFCSGRLRVWDDGEFQKLYCENVVKPLQESCNAW